MTRSAVKGVLAMAAAVSLWVLALPVGAASLDASGWWWRAQTGLGGIQAPTPPDVSDGQLLVESTPQEATAIAGVRFDLRSDEVQPILKLQVAEAANAGEAVLVACPAGAKWQAVQGGNWDDKPPAACQEGSVSGVPADDGSEWTFPVSALVPIFIERTVDVVIVPGETETGTNPSFRIVFEEPTSRSLETTREAPEVSVPPAGSFGDPDPTPATAADDSGSPDEGGGTFAGPTTPSEPGPTPEPALDPPRDAEGQQVTSSAPSRRVGTASAPEERSGRWAAVAILALGAAAAFWLFQQPMPVPRRLGPLASRHAETEAAPGRENEGEVRGIGRFRRPRSGEPPSL